MEHNDTTPQETLRATAAELPGVPRHPATAADLHGTPRLRFTRRDAWEVAIRTNAEKIMAVVGDVAPTAKEVLAALTKLDLLVVPVRGANGIGDAMGAVGLNLPVIEGYGAKRYFLPALTMSPEELGVLWSNKPGVGRYINEANARLRSSNP